MSLFDKLESVDRRAIFVLVFLVVAFPLVYPIGMPIPISPMTQAFYDAVEKLKPGDVAFISFDFSAASLPEQYPQSKAAVAHVSAKGAKIVAVTFWADGPIFIDNTFKAVFGGSSSHPKYGIDFVNLGYIVGAETAMASFGKDIQATAPKDYYGTATNSLSLMQNVKSAKDFNILIALSSGTPGYRELLRQIQAPYGLVEVAGVTAVVGPEVRPYFPQQIGGVIEGLAGAAEYEILLARYGFKGTLAAPMDAQSLGHVLVVLFVVLGNIGFVVRKYGRKTQA
ncbi:MAG: hypothetical protein V1857_05245 [archaeon]